MKMVSFNLVDQYNNNLRVLGEMPLAKEAIRHELSNISFASEHFGDGECLALVNNYNLLNRYSLVAYPSAYHNDHLNQLSLENNLLLVGSLTPWSGSCGTSRRSVNGKPPSGHSSSGPSGPSGSLDSSLTT